MSIFCYIGLPPEYYLLFLDDILVISEDFHSHCPRLAAVFDCLEKANLKLSPDKCELFQKSVKFLGHIVSGEGIQTDPDKIECVQNWPIPKETGHVRAFVGLAWYYRRFVKGFCDIAKPLQRLTEKNVDFVWDEKNQQAFDTLKKVLTEAPVLACPTPDGLFVLDTDASNHGSGGITNARRRKCHCLFQQRSHKS